MSDKFDKNKVTIVIRDQSLFSNLAKGYENSNAINKSQYICELLKAGLEVAGIMSSDDLMTKEELRKLLIFINNNYKSINSKMDQIDKIIENGYRTLIKAGIVRNG